MIQRSKPDVSHNDWPSLKPRAIGSFPANPVSVSVIIPAQNGQDALDLCLASLAKQNYPADLLEVLVADDRSDPPLQLPGIRPKHTRIIPVKGVGYASGMARDVAARQATGDVLLFIDADIVIDAGHVDAHARWHEVVDYALVLGVRQFVDVSGISPTDVTTAVDAGSIRSLTAGRVTHDHDWINRILDKTAELTSDRDDLWRPVVGASVSVRREFYERVGGFAHHPIRGIVDTEFGYRCFTAGAVIVPDRDAYSLHQGPRNIANNREAVIRRRDALAINLIPDQRYRDHHPGRAWSVPTLHVLVTPQDTTTFESLRDTIDDLIASDFDDVTVAYDPEPLGSDAELAADYWRSDARVDATTDLSRTGFPSPFTAVVPAGARLDPTTVGRVLAELRPTRLGLLTLYVEGLSRPVEVWRTRALERSRLTAGDESIRAVVRRLFGESALPGAEFGIAAAESV